MMGKAHATSGAVAWLAAQPLIDHVAPSLAAHGATEIVAATVVTAGAALLPDLDHPSSTIAHALGPVTHLLAKAVAKVAGGHRYRTHTVPFAVLAGYGAWWAQAGPWWVPALVVGLLAALAVTAVGVTDTRAASVLSAAAGFGILHVAGGTLGWLGPAVAVGCLAHCAGDLCTEEGIPAWWPATGRRVRVAQINSGSKVETHLVVPVLVVAAAVLAANLADPTLLAAGASMAAHLTGWWA